MLDLVQLQKDMTSVLLSYAPLVTVNIFSYREKRTAEELDYSTMLLTQRSGKSGAMVVVLLPNASAQHRQVSGPVLDWDLSFLVVELETVNHNKLTGTLLDCERIGQLVMDCLHMESDEAYGTLSVTGKPVYGDVKHVPKGCIGYMVNLTLQGGHSSQTPRCGTVQVQCDSVLVTARTWAAGTVQLSSNTPGARIKFTLDGSHPSDDVANNPSSITYSAPFDVEAGDILRCAAYADGYNKSGTRNITFI